MHADAPATSGLNDLLRLNEDFIVAVRTSDVCRFDEILADDFLCRNPDGSLVDRTRFLEQAAGPATVSDVHASAVTIRLMEDYAIVLARTSHTLPDGRTGSGHYANVWARRDGRWQAVSTHITGVRDRP